MKRFFLLLSLFAVCGAIYAQTGMLHGYIHAGRMPVEAATVSVAGNTVLTDSSGKFIVQAMPGAQKIVVSGTGYIARQQMITIIADSVLQVTMELSAAVQSLDDVVITGTLKEVKRTESPVPVEVYNPAFFKKNPAANMFEALQNINGVRPQLNCQVCNTGDIHINGQEGPYTMILLDGLPVVS